MFNKNFDELINDIAIYIVVLIFIIWVSCWCYYDTSTGVAYNNFVCVKIDVGDYYTIINDQYNKKIGGKGVVFLNSKFTQNIKIVDKNNNIIKEFQFQADKFDRDYSKNNITYKELK